MKSIFLCSSMNFYRELVDIEAKLTASGFVVDIPVSAKTMKKKGDFDVSHFKGTFTPEQKGEFIQTNFQNIAKSDAILVINNEKNGIQGYIGANVLMEIGLAFYLHKKIFILNPFPQNAAYNEELAALGVTVIKGDLSKIVI